MDLREVLAEKVVFEVVAGPARLTLSGVSAGVTLQGDFSLPLCEVLLPNAFPTSNAHLRHLQRDLP